MRTLLLADAIRYPSMTTRELRSTFLLDDLFRSDQVCLTYVDLDRTIIGSAVPAAAPLTLPCPAELRADSFTERREIGILNIGGAGNVTVNEQHFRLDSLDALYVGRGSGPVVFSSDDSHNPARFYLLSYPAHSPYPTQLIQSAALDRTRIGSPETANDRQIIKLIHLDGVRSSQLVMGFTQLASGSVWNTMPPHTHMRRSEVYLYFNLAPEARVVHFMGPSQETRHIVVANEQAVISPGWSIHAGVGTSNYSFCWGMGGENQVYSDMDPVAIADLL